MPAAREWVRRGGWTEGESWHLRPVPPPSRRGRSSTTACGAWFSSGDVLAVWGQQDGPPDADRCTICETASGLLEAMGDEPTDRASGATAHGATRPRTQTQ
jgi:hypothetical protein